MFSTPNGFVEINGVKHIIGTKVNNCLKKIKDNFVKMTQIGNEVIKSNYGINYNMTQTVKYDLHITQNNIQHFYSTVQYST